MIFSTLKCGSSVVNASKIKDFQVLMLTPFGSHFGGLLGAQMEAKAINKPSQKSIKKWCPKWGQSGPKGGPKMEPKSSKMRSWKHLASRVAPKWPPGPLQDRFWRGFGTMLGQFSSVFWTYVWWCLHAFCSSMLQTKTFKIVRKHQKNAAESFKKQLLSSCHLALNSSLANVNELSGPC